MGTLLSQKPLEIFSLKYEQYARRLYDSNSYQADRLFIPVRFFATLNRHQREFSNWLVPISGQLLRFFVRRDLVDLLVELFHLM